MMPPSAPGQVPAPGISVWLDKPEQWEKLALALERAGEFGIDTETYGQPERTSPQHRARVHVASFGVLGSARTPRGYKVATGRVVPAEALRHPGISGVLQNPKIRKWAHNAPHDYHALTNEGLVVEGMEDTLQWLRVAVPGMGSYGLKDAERWALGKGPRPDFLDVVTHQVEVVRTTYRTVTRCVCGKTPCRARSTSEWWDEGLGWFRQHTREEVKLPTEHRRIVDERWAVTDFVPGHERWEQWLAYSLADAVSAVELVDWLRNRRYKEHKYPWTPVSTPA